MLQVELKRVAAQIDALLREDSFPAALRPDFLREAVRSYPCRGGKRLRPALLLWCCGLLGGVPAKAIHAAAAVEIYHNWTLVHDDIIDDDNTRRGKPSSHAELRQMALEKFGLQNPAAEKFGRNFAILAGDVQQGWAVDMLLRAADDGVSPSLILALSRRLQELVNRELISGEALDVEFSYRKINSLSVKDVSEMLSMKTGALLKFCAETGAAIALNSPDFNDARIAGLGHFASTAGVAFQMRDDWLGIFGEPEKFGKPICSDLSESKPTLLLLDALRSLPEKQREQLMGLVGKQAFSSTDIESARSLIRDSGADSRILKEAAVLADDARKILHSYPDDGVYQPLLLELLDYLVGRAE